MSYAQAAATYQRNAILSASPEKLVKLLYDGAIKSLEQSRLGIADEATRRSPEVGNALSKALGIVSELRISLDRTAGGKIATDLDNLYSYSLDQITQSNTTRTPDGVNNAVQVLRTLKEGWDAVIPG
ncbi:flagellar protein FliS [Planctomycetota bacterium]|nr:flagellar protein FliS [Planctomycetota bacterium]